MRSTLHTPDRRSCSLAVGFLPHPATWLSFQKKTRCAYAMFATGVGVWPSLSVARDVVNSFTARIAASAGDYIGAFAASAMEYRNIQAIDVVSGTVSVGMMLSTLQIMALERLQPCRNSRFARI
jgi:hypothetical protein